MKTIADFKRKMTVGSKWFFISDYCEGKLRTCTHSQSNSFALTGVRDKKESSWCDWPKKKDVIFHWVNGKEAISINYLPDRNLTYVFVE